MKREMKVVKKNAYCTGVHRFILISYYIKNCFLYKPDKLILSEENTVFLN